MHGSARLYIGLNLINLHLKLLFEYHIAQIVTVYFEKALLMFLFLMALYIFCDYS